MPRALTLLALFCALLYASGACSSGGGEGGKAGSGAGHFAGSGGGGTGGDVRGGSGGSTGGNGGGGAGGGGDGGGGAGGTGSVACPTEAIAPETTFGHAMFWSAREGELVIIGGDHRPKDTTSNVYTNEVWHYRPTCELPWEKVMPVTAPTGRADFTAVYDPSRDRVVMFGGRLGESPNYKITDEVWIYDVAKRFFRKLRPSGKMPKARDGARAFWDSVNDRMVMFGGNNSSFQGFAPLNDTWELSFQESDIAPVWKQLDTNMNPPARWLAGLAVDPERGYAVMFGGQDGNHSPEIYYEDVWLFDLASSTWAQLFVDQDPTPDLFEHLPRRRFAAAMALGNDGAFYVFAGKDDYTQFERNDFWSLTVSEDRTRAQWGLQYFGDKGTRLVTDVDNAAPERRDRHAMAITPGGDVWVFGGEGPCGPLKDLWTRKVGGLFWTAKIPTDPAVNVCWRKAMEGQLCPSQKQCSEPRTQ